VLSSKVEFDKFKGIFKNLVHPAGFIEYAEYKIDKTINTGSITTATINVANTLAGIVNINSSIYVIGTNTKFNIAVTRGIMSVGSNIAVNSQIRTISSIISNTELRVSSAFTQSANAETLVIVT
jgi:hypothetical protein